MDGARGYLSLKGSMANSTIGLVKIVWDVTIIYNERLFSTGGGEEWVWGFITI